MLKIHNERTKCLNMSDEHMFLGHNPILNKDKNKNKAVYTAYVAPRRPKSKSITYGRTDGPTDRPTDGRTHALIESLRRN